MFYASINEHLMLGLLLLGASAIRVSYAQVVFGDRFNNPVSVCQNDASALDENLAVYNGEILIGNVDPNNNYVNDDDPSYLYSWITYTDTSLSQVYNKFGKKQISAGEKAKFLGHRTIVNAPAGSIIKYVVTDGAGSEVSKCFIGPVIELAKGEPNIEDRTSTRFFTKKNCEDRNPNHCIREVTNVFRKCLDGFGPVLYQPDNQYEGMRHKCEETIAARL